MKFLIVVAIVAGAGNAAPSGWLGHGWALGGPHAGPSSLAGPHAGPVALAGPASGPALISGAVAGPALITGAVAGPAAVIGSSAGPTHITGSAWDAGYGWGGHGAWAHDGWAHPSAHWAGPVVVAGPDGSSISAQGAGLGAVVAGPHAGHWGHSSHW